MKDMPHKQEDPAAPQQQSDIHIGRIIGHWLLYGFIAAFLHLFVYMVCFLGVELQHSDFQLRPSIGRWFRLGEECLSFPCVWLNERFMIAIQLRLPSSLKDVYGGLGFYWGLRLANSALWGFTISAVLLYISQRRRKSAHHDRPAS
jgi:hypothetical protein